MKPSALFLVALLLSLPLLAQAQVGGQRDAVAWQCKAEAFTIGATAKLAVSSMAGDKAVGLLADVGGAFRHPEQDLSIGLVGYQVRAFDGALRQAMPFDAQVGVSYKPEYMPVRLSLTAHHLHQIDIVYLDPNTKGRLDANGNEVKEEKKMGDKIARHFVIGSEFILSKKLSRAGRV